MDIPKNSKESSSSSSDNDSSEDEVDEKVHFREKRHVQWRSCTQTNNKSKVIDLQWPPTSSNSSWRNNLRHVQFGNPKYGQKMQLFCRTGYHLGIYHHHGVHGTRDEEDLHTVLELVNAGYPGHVRIKGLATNAYVGIDKKGKLYTEFDVKEESTIFIESLQGSYNVYLSRKYAHLGWYIGIKKSGKFKRGPQTGYGQKAIQFLPRRAKFQ